ncbi:TetR family transcriptional regulator [Streptomyces sp. NPDC058542]|uniref:TetR family transcriptional regulator n=1 Tax=Streptomyces sp. NPDC058542 TaxID=3346543 RepID=UPI00364E7779
MVADRHSSDALAAEADVAVTTLFSHFASKEALVFEQDQGFEQGLVRAVADRTPDEPLIPALRREIHALVRHCEAPDPQAAVDEIFRMIEAAWGASRLV